MTAVRRRPYPDLPLTLFERGGGRAALVLHGGAGPGSMTAVVDHLAATRRVLAPTHPGWEGTPRPDWFRGVDALVETYLDLVDDLALTDLLLLGSSFGGWVAAEMAVRDRGRRVSDLVLLDAIGPAVPGHTVSAPSGPPPGSAGAGRGPDPRNMAALTAYAGPDMADPELLGRLSRVRARSLVLWGEKVAVVSPDFGRAYAAAIPGARFEVIAGAGHVPSRERPEETLAALDAFLAGA